MTLNPRPLFQNDIPLLRKESFKAMALWHAPELEAGATTSQGVEDLVAHVFVLDCVPELAAYPLDGLGTMVDNEVTAVLLVLAGYPLCLVLTGSVAIDPRIRAWLVVAEAALARVVAAGRRRWRWS